jgi:hypothetical protein
MPKRAIAQIKVRPIVKLVLLIKILLYRVSGCRGSVLRYGCSIRTVAEMAFQTSKASPPFFSLFFWIACEKPPKMFRHNGSAHRQGRLHTFPVLRLTRPPQPGCFPADIAKATLAEFAGGEGRLRENKRKPPAFIKQKAASISTLLTNTALGTRKIPISHFTSRLRAIFHRASITKCST